MYNFFFFLQCIQPIKEGPEIELSCDFIYMDENQNNFPKHFFCDMIPQQPELHLTSKCKYNLQ